ncbi:hypothetical protein ILUMI_20297 [Ignelater luminosus]|uniref:Protein sleepless n=1 Tax=Ignelater luminosus TaxID=2038154 RepID=A0A8K0CEF5_IGNLU|nr:hypothetical protein ILUMI_20297 [Ignelater luminosus]
MPNYKCVFVFITVLLFSFIQRTFAVKCYKCKTTTHEDCKDPFDIIQTSTFADECKETWEFCLKEKRTDSYLVPELLSRGCAAEDYCENEQHSILHCSICKSDLCNSALKINSNFIFVLVAIIGSLVRFKNYF